MFDTKIQVRFSGLKLVIKKDVAEKRVRLKLSHPFDHAIAGALGPEARNARDGIASRALSKVIMEIDGIGVTGIFTSKDNEVVTIGPMIGVQAVATQEDDEEHPTIKLEFEFPFEREIFGWLGQNGGSWVEARLTRQQLDLALSVASGERAEA